MEATYILPIRHIQLDEYLEELTNYLYWLSNQVEVIVIDGSSPDVFTIHHASWNSFVTHIPPDPDIQVTNGKVRGVLTGLRRATHERVVIADEDVRYDTISLTRLVALLERAHVVRPQNYFDPLPWHARWDTGRTLLNRMSGGDWPGTLGVRLPV
ncbi:MAG: glycosyltransferase, partial [Chloroflexota bacterium]|nr:glycosyltransferase [Chloroflexota bacterium]